MAEIEIKNTNKAEEQEKQEIPQAKQEDPNKNTKIFIAIMAIAIALFIGFIIYGLVTTPTETRDTMEYNYFNFTMEGGLWKTTLQRGTQEYEILLRFNPEQVEDIEFKGNVNRSFFEGPIYITFDPESNEEQMKYLALGGAELSLNVVRALGIEVQAACTKNETDACINRTIKTCDSDANVIEMRTGPTKVEMENNCVIVQGEGMELLKSIDRILYHWYGIINPLDDKYDAMFNATIQNYKNQ